MGSHPDDAANRRAEKERRTDRGTTGRTSPDRTDQNLRDVTEQIAEWRRFTFLSQRHGWGVAISAHSGEWLEREVAANALVEHIEVVRRPGMPFTWDVAIANADIYGEMAGPHA